MKSIDRFAPGINKYAYNTHKKVYSMDEGGYHLYQDLLIGSDWANKMFVKNKSGKMVLFHEGLTSGEWRMLYGREY